jgi:hypothetical protein
MRAAGGGPELALLSPGDVVTVGRDSQNRVQIGHHSVEPIHARLSCDEWGVWVTPIGGSAVAVDGEKTTSERVVAPGKPLEIGALRFEFAFTQHEPAPTRRGARLRQAIEQAASMTVSAALHVAILLLVRRVTIETPVERVESDGNLALAIGAPSSRYVANEPAQVSSDPLAASAPKIAADRTDELLVAVAPSIGDDVSQLPTSTASSGDTASAQPGSNGGDLDFGLDQLGSLRGTVGVGASGSGGGASGRSGLRGNGHLSLDGDVGVGRALVTKLQALRGCGVDLVFVIDTTSSMQPFLDHARRAANSLVGTLATLVEDLRVGVVAYRDKGDEYLTRVLELSDDRYEILNFLWSLRAAGGGDAPEAVADGIHVAVEKAGWRSRAHRVLVVIGDAPPHPQDWTRLKADVNRFVRKADQVPGAVVSAIYTGPPHEQIVNAAEDGAPALETIAKQGHGDYVAIGAQSDVGERLLALTLGPNHAKELQALVARVEEDPRTRLVQQHAAAGDRPWLIEKLRHRPVHPAVVDALVDLADRDVLWEARKTMTNSQNPRETREAALYILRRCVPAAAELELDRPAELQHGAMERLDASILRR